MLKYDVEKNSVPVRNNLVSRFLMSQAHCTVHTGPTTTQEHLTNAVRFLPLTFATTGSKLIPKEKSGILKVPVPRVFGAFNAISWQSAVEQYSSKPYFHTTDDTKEDYISLRVNKENTTVISQQ